MGIVPVIRFAHQDIEGLFWRYRHPASSGHIRNPLHQVRRRDNARHVIERLYLAFVVAFRRVKNPAVGCRCAFFPHIEQVIDIGLRIQVHGRKRVSQLHERAYQRGILLINRIIHD